jgi:hypothetical protein
MPETTTTETARHTPGPFRLEERHESALALLNP